MTRHPVYHFPTSLFLYNPHRHSTKIVSIMPSSSNLMSHPY